MKEYDPNDASPNTTIYAYSSKEDINWTKWPVSDCGARHPSLAVDSQGNAHVVFVGNEDCTEVIPLCCKDAIYHFVHDGSGWISKELVAARGANPGEDYLFRPSITIDTDDRVHIVWRYSDDDLLPSVKIEYWNSTDRVVELVAHSTDPLHYDFPSVAVDQLDSGNLNRPNIVLEDRTSASPEIRHYQKQGTGWQPIDYVSVGLSINGGITPSLAADVDGNLHAIWKSGQDLYHDVYINCGNPANVRWAKNCRSSGNPLLVRDLPLGHPELEFPSIHGNVAVWVEQIAVDPKDWDLFYAYYGGFDCRDEWSDATNLTNSFPDRDLFPHVFTTPIGNPPFDCRLDIFYTERRITVWHVLHKNEILPCFLGCLTLSSNGDESSLLASSPNPFQSIAEIAYEIPKGEEGEVSLKVYDVSGRVVRVLVDGRKREGRYIERWDGRDRIGRDVPLGVYFYRLDAGGMTETKKVILLR